RRTAAADDDDVATLLPRHSLNSPYSTLADSHSCSWILVLGFLGGCPRQPPHNVSMMTEGSDRDRLFSRRRGDFLGAKPFHRNVEVGSRGIGRARLRIRPVGRSLGGSFDATIHQPIGDLIV